MSSDSSSECTQDEMSLTEVKIEPGSDSEGGDSRDPLSLEQTPAVSLEPSSDPLSPSEKTTPDRAKHKVPTLVGLLDKNVSILGQKPVVPNPLSSEKEKTNMKSKKDTGDEDTRGPRNYTCLRCGFMTSLDSALRSHMSTLHPEAVIEDIPKKIQKDAVTKTWKCDICNTYFPQEAMLETHKLCQHPKTPSIKHHACDQCSFTTTCFKSLKKHQKIHSGKKYNCKKCDYTSVYSNSLKRHSFTHTEEKPFPCDLCKYTATEATHLRRHKQRKHLGERPFACDLCDYTATALIYVRRHKRKDHLGIEQCDSTTKEIESVTKKDAETNVDLMAEDSGKIPFITGDT